MVIDTNIILRYLLGDDDKAFVTARRIIESEKKLSCSSVVLAECVYVLKNVYSKTNRQIADGLLGFLSRDNIIDVSGVGGISLGMYKRANLDFADCYLIALSLDRGQPLKTFDKKMQKIYQQEKAKQG